MGEGSVLAEPGWADAMRAHIVATGSALPTKVLHNADLARMVSTSDEWIRERTGIQERRIVADGTASSDLGTEVMSAVMDWTDRSTCILFGDGAGAVLLEPSTDDNGILSSHLHSDGNLWDLVCVEGGGSRIPASAKMLESRQHLMKMKGNETFKVAVKMLEATAREALAANHLDVKDVDLFIPHQANVRILNAVAERLGLEPDRLVVNMDRYGNTSAASIPLALDEAVQAGRVKPGSRILMAAFGSGLTWASALVKW